MDSVVKNVLKGFGVGMLVTLVGASLYILVMFKQFDLIQAYQTLFKNGLLAKVITLGTLPNVLVFHYFIKQQKFYHARGVLMAVVVLALFFAYLKFF